MSFDIQVFASFEKARRDGVIEQMSSSLEYREYFCPLDLCNTMFRPREFGKGHGLIRKYL